MTDYTFYKDKEDIAPEGTVREKYGECFLRVGGKWKQVIGSEGKNLLQSPTDVAPVIINATITYEPPKPFSPSSPLLKREPCVVPRFSVYELEEIAKHILLYCKFRNSGCCGENNSSSKQITDAILILRHELLQHGEIYDGFKSSLKSALEAYNYCGMPFEPEEEIAGKILDFLIGEEKSDERT